MNKWREKREGCEVFSIRPIRYAELSATNCCSVMAFRRRAFPLLLSKIGCYVILFNRSLFNKTNLNLKNCGHIIMGLFGGEKCDMILNKLHV